MTASYHQVKSYVVVIEFWFLELILFTSDLFYTEPITFRHILGF